MAAPLSPTPSTALNFSTPSTAVRHETYEAQSRSVSSTPTPQSRPAGDNTENSNDSDEASSPFLSHVKDDASPTTRGPSPPKARPGSRIISGSELSPLKILQQQQQMQIQAQTQNQQSPAPSEDTPSPAKSMPPPPLPQSPRKMPAPIKRFPIKVSQPSSAASESPRRSSNERRPSAERPTSLEAVRENEGLKHAIDIFEDEANGVNGGLDGDDDDDHTLLGANDGHDVIPEDDHSALAEDSMISSFSTFSAVPDLTMLARLRSNSPTKFSAMNGASVRAAAGVPQTPRANGPLPDRSGTGHMYDSGGGGGNTTTNLLDFTEQLRFGGYGIPQATPSRAPYAAATPQRPGGGNNLVSLLDFDMPPAPTPRSVPSITPRELESLKSGFLSEISSLKASLSGKEAEVLSLKAAVGDAEKRVGECMEQLREVEGVLEPLRAEKDSWERRARELESVLCQVREEVLHGRHEREELEFKLDEAEKRREAAEMMAQEAESKMAGMKAGRASAAETTDPLKTNKEVEKAVEAVARDLHALYKIKHQDKVNGLKKSYEQRWKGKVLALQAQVDELTREREMLRAGLGGNNNNNRMVDPAVEEERRAERARDAAQIQELRAEVEKVEAVLKTVQADNAELRVLLERERVEKGELVMLAEEMMSMQSSFIGAQQDDHNNSNNNNNNNNNNPTAAAAAAPTPRPSSPPTPATAARTSAKTPGRRQSSSLPASRNTPGGGANTARHSVVMGGEPHNGNANPFRMSVNGGGMRASGLKAPGVGLKGPAAGGESRIGRVNHHERTRSTMGLPRPGSGQGSRATGTGTGPTGGIMSSIERMGMGMSRV